MLCAHTAVDLAVLAVRAKHSDADNPLSSSNISFDALPATFWLVMYRRWAPLQRGHHGPLGFKSWDWKEETHNLARQHWSWAEQRRLETGTICAHLQRSKHRYLLPTAGSPGEVAGWPRTYIPFVCSLLGGF